MFGCGTAISIELAWSHLENPTVSAQYLLPNDVSQNFGFKAWGKGMCFGMQPHGSRLLFRPLQWLSTTLPQVPSVVESHWRMNEASWRNQCGWSAWGSRFLHWSSFNFSSSCSLPPHERVRKAEIQRNVRWWVLESNLLKVRRVAVAAAASLDMLSSTRLLYSYIYIYI